MRHGRHFAGSKVGHNFGARSGRFVCEIAICFKALASSSAWFARGPEYCLQIGSGRPQDQKTNVSGVVFVAWQWLLHSRRQVLSANERPNWSLLTSLLPRGTVIKDTRLERTSIVFVPGRFGCQVLRLRRLPLLREGHL